MEGEGSEVCGTVTFCGSLMYLPYEVGEQCSGVSGMHSFVEGKTVQYVLSLSRFLISQSVLSSAASQA